MPDIEKAPSSDGALFFRRVSASCEANAGVYDQDKATQGDRGGRIDESLAVADDDQTDHATELHDDRFERPKRSGPMGGTGIVDRSIHEILTHRFEPSATKFVEREQNERDDEDPMHRTKRDYQHTGQTQCDTRRQLTRQ